MTCRLAISRWENEGGTVPPGWLPKSVSDAANPAAPPLKNAELVQLQIRIIALENLVIGLLAKGCAEQRAMAHDMAAYITPRPGFSRHRLTIHAAAQMVHLVERAAAFSLCPDERISPGDAPS